MTGALPSLQFPLNQSHCNTVTITCILIVTSLTQPVRDTVAAALQDTPWLRCALRFCEHWLVEAAAAAAMQCSRDVQTASGEGDGSSYWVAAVRAQALRMHLGSKLLLRIAGVWFEMRGGIQPR